MHLGFKQLSITTYREFTDFHRICLYEPMDLDEPMTLMNQENPFLS